MALKYLGLFSGRAKTSAIVENKIADEAIHMGDPVIEVAPASGERDSRVEPNNSQGAKAFGIVVDGDQKNPFVDGARGSDELAANAGENVAVCTHGPCLARVNGATGAIAIGDDLTIDAADGSLEKAAASDEVIAVAQQASTAADDVILVHVGKQGVL